VVRLVHPLFSQWTNNMIPRLAHRRCLVVTLALSLSLGGAVFAQDPLASWNDSPAKQADPSGQQETAAQSQ
jgi:hypothetical protein